MTRVAAVDLGTNSTRLLVADVEDGRVDEVVRRSVVTRLGEGVDARRRLLPVPIARVRNALTDFRRELEALGAERTLAVATSAVRDADNGEAFLGEVEWSYGFATRLLSGEEEADLTRRGLGAVDVGTLVLDVGGGSTELHHRRLQDEPRCRVGSPHRTLPRTAIHQPQASSPLRLEQSEICCRRLRPYGPSAWRERWHSSCSSPARTSFGS